MVRVQPAEYWKERAFIVTIVEAQTVRWDHAVVIGAGYGGLLAARVLADRFRRVTLVERDEITESDEYRGGVPQSHHPHIMLARGSEILEELFPGLRAELAEAGCPTADFGLGFRRMLAGGWAPATELGIPMQSFTRPRLEQAIRARVGALPQVTVLQRVQVDGLAMDTAGRRVTGVVAHRRPAGPADRRLEIAADLVVDASGRTSRLPDWLQRHGFQRPGQRVVDANLTYTSRLFAIPPGEDPDWLASGAGPAAPSQRRGGTVVTVEGRRWLVALMGAGGELPPNDEAGFREYARSVRNPDVGDVADRGVPLSAPVRFTRLANRWVHYHQMREWPDRLVAVGDSICAFNPLYGQGMTVAAVECLMLRDALRRQAASGRLTGFTGPFQRRVVRAIRIPWLMATSADQGWSVEPASPITRTYRWYVGNLTQLLPSHDRLYRRFVRTQHMLDGLGGLLSPATLLLIGWHLARRAARPRPGPATAVGHLPTAKDV